ncbi:MAG: hypothetical protein NZL91_05960 [Thermoflexales bacterium]|nr:hypothetical protein [Thermoflexales bacterium]MDW8292335.1 hypothetical protein [Anaerolineae bacterium]
MARLVLSWNVRPQEEAAYYEFIVQEFAPALSRVGIELEEVWLTLYGEGPQVIVSGNAPSREALQQMLETEEWKEIEAHLKTLVTDYRLRIFD